MWLSRLSAATLHWRNAHLISAPVWSAWPRDHSADLTFFGAVTPLAAPSRGNAIWRSFDLRPLDRMRRIAIWKQHTAALAPDAVANRVLTPAQIASAVRVAPAVPQAIGQACHHMILGVTSELFTALACPYTWDNIVLNPGLRRHLAELETQARLRWQVYEEWGFGKLCPLGKGITAMFAGPSGTGKTTPPRCLRHRLAWSSMRYRSCRRNIPAGWPIKGSIGATYWSWIRKQDAPAAIAARHKAEYRLTVSLYRNRQNPRLVAEEAPG
jgi:hypothetical protein